MGVSYYNCKFCESIYCDHDPNIGCCDACNRRGCRNCYSDFGKCNWCSDDENKMCDDCKISIECIKCEECMSMCIKCYNKNSISCNICKTILCNECKNELSNDTCEDLNNSSYEDSHGDSDKLFNEYERSNENSNMSIIEGDIVYQNKSISKINKYFRYCLNCKNIYCINCILPEDNLEKCDSCNYEKKVRTEIMELWNNFVNKSSNLMIRYPTYGNIIRNTIKNQIDAYSLNLTD